MWLKRGQETAKRHPKPRRANNQPPKDVLTPASTSEQDRAQTTLSSQERPGSVRHKPNCDRVPTDSSSQPSRSDVAPRLLSDRLPKPVHADSASARNTSMLSPRAD